MIKKNWLWIGCLAAFAIGCSKSEPEPGAAAETTGASGGATNDKGASATTASYTAVQDVFTKNCVGCHGASGGKGGINLTSHDGVIKGGEDGPIVTAGDPEKSKLIDALRGRNGAKQMPMNSTPLPEDQIKSIEDWIKAGAKA